MEKQIQEPTGEKKDRRVRKTKRAVHTALLQLMTEKKISKISVKELTEKADVNRKTFYNHYSDIYAVLDEMENECIDRIISLLNLQAGDQHIYAPDTVFTRLISELKDNPEFFTLLRRSEAHSYLLPKLIDKEKEIFRQMLNTDQVNEVWMNCFLNYISAGTTSVINDWFLSDRKIPEESLAQFFGTLFSESDMRRFIEYATLPG